MVLMLRDLLRWPSARWARVSGLLMMVVISGLSLADVARAQERGVHFLHAGVMAPGAIGRRQLTRGGPLRGYVQPIEIRTPKGTRVALAADGAFVEPVTGPLTVGLFVSPVYRLKVTNIALQPGAEVFPTLEVIDRLYPPLGQERKFPIPVELTREELELALAGKFVTRVIYLENPKSALAYREPKHQNWMQIRQRENPLEVADRLGRPVAILRLGGRLPSADGPDERFLYGSPSWIKYSDDEKNEKDNAGASRRGTRRDSVAVRRPEREATRPTVSSRRRFTLRAEVKAARASGGVSIGDAVELGERKRAFDTTTDVDNR